MTQNIQADATPIKSRISASTNFTGFIFGWLKQVDSDPETCAQEFRLAWLISQMLNKKTRVCFPLQATLAERMGVSVRAVGGYISDLRRRGHLRVQDRGRDKSSVYEPILHDRNAVSGHDTVRPQAAFHSSADDPNEDWKSDVVRPEISRCKTGTVLPTEPTSEPTSEPKERGAPKARRTTDSLKSTFLGNTVSLESPLDTGTITGDSGVASRAPPPNHLQRAVARARRLMIQAGAQ
jgi:hypothetical protein